MKQLLSFTRLLRDAGLGVALSELADASTCLQLVNSPCPGDLHFRVLQACMVKRVEDRPVFNTVYNIFFEKQISFNNSFVQGEALAPLENTSGMQSGGLPSLAKAMLNGDFSPCSNSIQLSAAGLRCDHTDIHEQVRQALVSLDFFGALNTLRLARLKQQIPEWAYHHAIERNAGDLIRLVEQIIIQQRLLLDMPWSEAAAHLNWRNKNFGLLSRAEMGLVKKYLEKIGRKLAVREGYKEKLSTSGRLNFPKTIGRALSTGGSCVKLIHARKFPEKPELILLCDVSNSVYQFTGFMLQLIAAFRQRFDKVQAHVFVDKLWRIPNDILRKDIGQALEDIREKNRCSRTGLSDYGQVFTEFRTSVLPNVHSKTVLIILGDGKNNWRPLELESFKQISTRMNKVFWLNPQAREHWGQEDCQIGKYSPFCTAVFECGNLAQLEQVAVRIL